MTNYNKHKPSTMQGSDGFARGVCRSYSVCILVVLSALLAFSCDINNQSASQVLQPLPDFSILDVNNKNLSKADLLKNLVFLYAPKDLDVDNQIIDALSLFEDLNPEKPLKKVLILREERSVVFPDSWDVYISRELDEVLRETYSNFGVLALRDGVGIFGLPLNINDPINISVRLHNAIWGEEKPFREHMESHLPHQFIPSGELTDLVGLNGGEDGYRFFCINTPMSECNEKRLPVLLQLIRPDSKVKQYIVFGPRVGEHEITSLASNFDFPCEVVNSSREIDGVWSAFDRLNYNYLTNFLLECNSDNTATFSKYLTCETLEEYIER